MADKNGGKLKFGIIFVKESSAYDSILTTDEPCKNTDTATNIDGTTPGYITCGSTEDASTVAPHVQKLTAHHSLGKKSIALQAFI